MQRLLEKELVLDGTMGNDLRQNSNLWQLRENITESISKEGHVFKYDISLPIPYFYAIVEETRKKFTGLPASVKGFGHLGDGNLHLNVVSSLPAEHVLDELEPFVYEWTMSHGGSISAEHGLGLAKAKYLGLSKGENIVSIMGILKNQFDRNGILNPYKIFPEQFLDCGLKNKA
jgi:D-2-hydroxyglutarate dehydrogenase